MHKHDHCTGSISYNRAFALGVLLNVTYLVIEAICGFMFGSLALLADAGHNLSDVLGLVLAWGGLMLSQVKNAFRRCLWK